MFNIFPNEVGDILDKGSRTKYLLDSLCFERLSPMEENWFRIILVTKDWKEVRIPFNSLSLHKGLAIRLGTNQIMELNYVEKIEWIATEHYVELGTEGIIWIDEISFY